MIRESAVESFEEALDAQNKGAERIELCENLTNGGTTPSYGSIRESLNTLKVPVFIMIRPRGGNFVYTKEEIQIMKYDIEMCKELGVEAVVFGILTEDNKINLEATKELVELAKPMEVTFHKAIDVLENPVDHIDDLVNIGVTRILTSGTKDTAVNGLEMINKMIDKAAGRLTIVVAGKVTKDNLEELSKKINTTEFHGKIIV